MKRFQKNPSTYDKGQRQEVSKIRSLAAGEKRPSEEENVSNPKKAKTHGHDPEYYHSDNKQNRARPGAPRPAESPNKAVNQTDE